MAVTIPINMQKLPHKIPIYHVDDTDLDNDNVQIYMAKVTRSTYQVA
jgi:hypothetical protein